MPIINTSNHSDQFKIYKGVKGSRSTDIKFAIFEIYIIEVHQTLKVYTKYLNTVQTDCTQDFFPMQVYAIV